MVIMNAASSVITTKSSYITRVSMTLPQVSAPMAAWAVKNKLRKVVTLVADYAPGIDAETAFKTNFIGGGGQVVESIRCRCATPEFAPFIQRIRTRAPRPYSCSCRPASRASPS